MLWFVIAIILAIASAFAGIFAKSLTAGAREPKPGLLRAAAGVGLFVAFLSFALSGLHSVPTKSLGVPVFFGKVDGSPYGPGAHLTWNPFLHLRVVSSTIQTTKFEGCQGQFCQKGDQPGQTILAHGDTGSSTQPCLEVKMGGQQAACIDVTIQWRVRKTATDSLFSDYANQGPLMPVIDDAVVIRELQQVVNQAMANYNPIVDVAENSTAGNSQFATYGPKILSTMRADIGNRVQVLSILWSLPRYDALTQKALHGIQQSYANTAIARQTIATNHALAASYAQLAKALAANPDVLVNQCLQIIGKAEQDGFTGLPASMGCISTGTNLLLGAKR